MKVPSSESAVSPLRWLRLFASVCLFTILVVFIVFMTITPLRHDLPAFVEVPSAWSFTKSPEREGDLTITIAAGGRVFLGIAEVGPTTLERRLAAARLRASDAPIVRLRVDRAAQFHHVRRAVRAAQNAGYARVTFSVRVPEPVSSGPGFSLIGPPPTPADDWWPVGIAAGCVVGALLIRFTRRSPSVKPGCGGWVLLLIAALAIHLLWFVDGGVLWE